MWLLFKGVVDFTVYVDSRKTVSDGLLFVTPMKDCSVLIY